MLLDIRATFGFVDGHALLNCLLINAVPEKCLSVLKNCIIPPQIGLGLTAAFVTRPRVKYSTTWLPRILISFASCHRGCCTEVNSSPGNKHFDLDYADDITLWSDDAQAIQLVFDRLASEVSSFGMCFAPSKHKIVLQDRMDFVFTLTFVVIS